jgi:hypothetical protein
MRTAWVVMNNANLYYGRGGFAIQDMMHARLFTPEEAAQLLRIFPDTVAIRVEVEECDPTPVVETESVVA